MPHRPSFSAIACVVIACLFALSAAAQNARQIMRAVDDSDRATLSGNVRPEANGANDRGRVPDGLPLTHMLLQLQRSPQQEQAAAAYVASLYDPASPNYHQWLTASEFGASFGVNPSDLAQIVSWLTSHGFTVNQVYPNGMLIDFSGTAGQIRAAFKTEIHDLSVNGAAHIGNMTDPQIPAALAPVVAGIVSLHDFMPHHAAHPRSSYSFTSSGTTEYAVVPGDLAVIYNFSPVFSAGLSGQGQTIVVIEDTNVYSTADWTAFRSAFGLSSYTGASFSQVHPGSNCSNPGDVVGDDFEAILDAEWASAAAPSAAIELASCADTRTTFGGLIALQNLISSSSPPKIVSISYGECETLNGAISNAAYNAAYQQAAAEGVSVFVAAGDWGAAVCDAGGSETVATHGIGVNAFASTPYNVAVGGTDFEDTYLGKDFNLLELEQFQHLRVGQIVCAGNSLERFLRQHTDREICHGFGRHLRFDRLLQHPDRPRILDHRRRQRRAQRLRHRQSVVVRRHRRFVQGLRQAELAIGARQSVGRRARSARYRDVRGQRRVGALLRHLLFQPRRRRRALHRRAVEMAGRRRHVVRRAHHGGHPSFGEPEDGRRAGTAQPGLLRPGRGPI